MKALKTLVLIEIWKQSDYNIIEYTFFITYNLKVSKSLVVVGFVVLSDDRAILPDYREVFSDHSLIFQTIGASGICAAMRKNHM